MRAEDMRFIDGDEVGLVGYVPYEFREDAAAVIGGSVVLGPSDKHIVLRCDAVIKAAIPVIAGRRLRRLELVILAAVREALRNVCMVKDRRDVRGRRIDGRGPVWLSDLGQVIEGDGLARKPAGYIGISVRVVELRSRVGTDSVTIERGG